MPRRRVIINPEFDTAGEVLAGRALKKEKIVGVDHYVPGQYHAAVDSDEHGILIAKLTFVNQGGHAVVIPCWKLGDEWQHGGLGRVAGQEHAYPAEGLGSDWSFSKNMLEALAAGEKLHKEKK